MWYLERNKIITPAQSGFRKGRSTTDQLVRLESFVREAFFQKQHVTAIFFDLGKAYDTTSKFGILKDLHDAGLRADYHFFSVTGSSMSQLADVTPNSMNRKRAYLRETSYLLHYLSES